MLLLYNKFPSKHKKVVNNTNTEKSSNTVQRFQIRVQKQQDFF